MFYHPLNFFSSTCLLSSGRLVLQLAYLTELMLLAKNFASAAKPTSVLHC